jgi:hypothetical protein
MARSHLIHLILSWLPQVSLKVFRDLSQISVGKAGKHSARCTIDSDMRILILNKWATGSLACKDNRDGAADMKAP